jgi:hypothetical protein
VVVALALAVAVAQVAQVAQLARAWAVASRRSRGVLISNLFLRFQEPTFSDGFARPTFSAITRGPFF